MKRQYAVIGLGRFGYSVAKTLAECDCEVVAIDVSEEKVNAVAEFVTYAVQLDAMDEKSLKSVSVQNVDVAVVSIGENIEASILVVMILKELGVKNIVAKAVSPLHGKVLEKIGVNRVVFPERDMAVRVAHSLIRPNILEQLELSQEYSIVELPAPKTFLGKTIKDNHIRSKYGVNLIAIRRSIEGKDVWNVNPMATDIINAGDILVVVGSNENVGKLGTEE